MLHKTKGIVLRSVKYGETSLIATFFTELFGLQSYLVNGVRMKSAKGNSKIALFSPGALLDLVVYHQDTKNLQRIKEFSWDYLYQNIFSDVVTNAVALYMIELVQKCLKQPEPNSELYYFLEHALQSLDKSDSNTRANFAIYFSFHLAGFFGLRIDDNYSIERHFLDLQEGCFVNEKPFHPHYLDDPLSMLVSDFLKRMQPVELADIPLNRDIRRQLLQACEDFFSLHITGFTVLKTLPVLRTILDGR